LRRSCGPRQGDAHAGAQQRFAQLVVGQAQAGGRPERDEQDVDRSRVARLR
jgi:hypothetical protein